MGILCKISEFPEYHRDVHEKRVPLSLWLIHVENQSADEILIKMDYLLVKLRRSSIYC